MTVCRVMPTKGSSLQHQCLGVLGGPVTETWLTVHLVEFSLQSIWRVTDTKWLNPRTSLLLDCPGPQVKKHFVLGRTFQEFRDHLSGTKGKKARSLFMVRQILHHASFYLVFLNNLVPFPPSGSLTGYSSHTRLKEACLRGRHPCFVSSNSWSK